jgi:hypothetical protein
MKNVNGPLFQHTSANAILKVITTARLNDDGFNAPQPQQVRQQ